MAAQSRNEFSSAQFREHQIYNEKIIGRFQSHCKTGSAISRFVHGEPLGLEPERHESYNLFLIFNNQESHFVGILSYSSSGATQLAQRQIFS
jgi:hypothetical protein